MLSALVSLGRQTVTGMLCTGGRQFSDWSAAYRLFARDRWDEGEARRTIRRRVLDELPPEAPFVSLLDDTLLHKSGTHIPGVGWRRDPLGPKFRTNFVRAQRFFQLSAALPVAEGPSPAKTIPLDFIHTPTPVRPQRNAPPEAWTAYRLQQREQRLSQTAVERIQELRSNLDAEGAVKRPLWTVGDGGYTNETVLKQLPANTDFIGRVRLDAELYFLPEAQPEHGRKRVYGEKAPTPEQLRQDESVPYQTVTAWAAGRVHDFKVKTLAPLRWRKAGERHNLRLVVIAPLGYRLRQGSRLLYRKPAYLLCTRPDIPVEKVVQAYVWRSGIEVNFREEKQIIGVGQAQVRDARSVEKVPAFLVAGYALLQLAAWRVYGRTGFPETLPPPKWRRRSPSPTATTSSLIQQLRQELWGKALGTHFSPLVSSPPLDAKGQKYYPHLASAVLYQQN